MGRIAFQQTFIGFAGCRVRFMPFGFVELLACNRKPSIQYRSSRQAQIDRLITMRLNFAVPEIPENHLFEQLFQINCRMVQSFVRHVVGARARR